MEMQTCVVTELSNHTHIHVDVTMLHALPSKLTILSLRCAIPVVRLNYMVR